MFVKQAKDAARQWVIDEARAAPGFCGAFYHGSMAWLPDDAVLPATSDVDVVIVHVDPTPPATRGKVIYQDVLLDISYLPADQLRSPDQILGLSHLAGSLRTATIILDPSGRLTALQAAVSRDYAKRRWVYQRCKHARDKILRNLADLDDAAPLPFHDQVIPWLFATGVTTHVLLVAGLRNPTVRRRYVAARDLLEDYGRLDFYHPLLDLLGCAHMSRVRVEQHLAALTAVFDAATVAVKTPFAFASDLSVSARPIAIDGSRDLIERGYHREAIFWVAATYSRCQKTLYHDGSVELRERFSPGYRRLLGDLGITSFADLQQRGEQVKRFLPRLWEVTEAIIAANPDIAE